MGISINSGSVNRGTTDPSQNKASKAKSEADKNKTIQSGKESSHVKTDTKDHQKLLKSLYVSRGETIKNFGLAGKSLLGSMPVLSPWKGATDTSHAKGFKDDSNESSAKDEPKSTNKPSSKTLSSSVVASKSSRKNLKEKDNTLSNVAKNQSKTNVNKNNKVSTATKGTHGKTIHSKAKISKANSDAISTQQEMDEFVDTLMQSIKIFQGEIGAKKSKSLNTKDSLKAKSKGSKSASGTSSFNDDNSSLAKKSESTSANKDYSVPMSEHSKSHQTKSQKYSSDGSEISDDKTDSEANTSHLDKNIPDHILDARKRSMALKGNISNIANNASLQSLINRYLDTRGSYSIKIMIEMEKLKSGKGKTETANLTDAQKSRSLASDRQISAMKKVNKKQEEARDVQKGMGVLGVLMSVVAVIVAIVTIVATVGTTAAAMACAVVGLIAGLTSLGITSANISTSTVDGRTMGSFDAQLYRTYRHYGVSKKDSLEQVQYANIGIQAALIIVTLGATAGAGAQIGSVVVSFMDTVSNKIAITFPSLASWANAGTRLQSFMTQFFQTSISGAETVNTLVRQIAQLMQGSIGMTDAGLTAYKTSLNHDATLLQGKVTAVQGMFENIEQHEHVAQLLLQKSIKRISEATGSVMKTIDSEYQAIKLLNMRSKVA
jgi:hypothetical protein